MISLTSTRSALHFSQLNKNVTIPFLWNGTIPFHSTLFQNRTHPCIVVNCCPYTAIPFHLHPALYASVYHRFILYITADVCCSSIFICRLKLLSLHWSKGLQLLLMRHLQRLPPSYCQPHLLDAYISSSPRTSRAVTIQGFGYIFLSHIYMPWFMSDIITGSV